MKFVECLLMHSPTCMAFSYILHHLADWFHNHRLVGCHSRITPFSTWLSVRPPASVGYFTSFHRTMGIIVTHSCFEVCRMIHVPDKVRLVKFNYFIPKMPIWDWWKWNLFLIYIAIVSYGFLQIFSLFIYYCSLIYWLLAGCLGFKTKVINLDLLAELEFFPETFLVVKQR